MIHPTMRASDYRDQTAPLCRRPLLGLAWRMRELAQPPGSDFFSVPIHVLPSGSAYLLAPSRTQTDGL